MLASTPTFPARSRSRWDRSVARACVACAVVGVVASVASPVLATPRAATKSRVTFGVEPATSQRADTRPHFDFGVTPGATLTDHVAVLNFSAKPLSLQLYATDAINTSNGGFGLLPASTKPTGAGSWVTLPAPDATVRVPAQTKTGPGQVIVPFSLRVPDNATPGDHVGAIVASLRTVGHNATGQNLVLDQRVGSRLFVRVSGTLTPKLTLTDLKATYHGSANPIGAGAVTVTYRVTNSGNVELALNQSVTVSGLLGANHQAAVASVPLLLPGDSLAETSALSGVWPQFIAHVKVTARPLAAAGDADPQLAPVSATVRLLAVPWPLLALLIILIVALRLGVVVRKRRSSRIVALPVAEPVNA